MGDLYQSYAQLAAAETEGVDYLRTSLVPAGSTWSSIAIHGGGIEAGSGELAQKTAEGLMAYYEFDGIKSSGNLNLHITSTKFDEPIGVGVVANTTHTISWHGYAGTTGLAQTAIGGLDAPLRERIRAALINAGFSVITASEEINGDQPTNICNRNIRSAGVQLELSRAQRQAFFPNGDTSKAIRDDPTKRTQAFFDYVNAVRSAYQPPAEPPGGIGPGSPVRPPRLGCAGTYTALLYYWDRALGKLRYYTELTGIIEISWERVLDDFSEARLRFRPSKGDDCCGKLKPKLDAQGNLLEPGVWPWAHELAIFRDGELVWQGPVFSVDETIAPDETTDNIQITARDVLAWLDRRVIHTDLFLNDREYDLVEISERIIRDAFNPDDPGVLIHLSTTMSGRTGKRTVRKWEAKSGDELRDVARGGVDFTAIGRKIIIKGPSYNPAVSTRTLRTKDFQSGIEIRIVGAEAATAGVAVGTNPTDPSSTAPPPENVPPPKVYYGGRDPFFGLIENWSQSDTVSNDSFLLWVAKQAVAEGNPPPLTLSVPADSGLNPEAPISIHDLVPGRYFTVRVAGTCRELVQLMRLSHVQVTWAANQPEHIGVTFIPQDVLVGGG